MQQLPPFAKTAANLLENGFSPLPILPKAKRPAISGWQRYGLNPPTEDQIDQWSTWPNHGVGVAMGQIVALDVDTDRPEILEAVANSIEPSPAKRRGKKGYAGFYRLAPGFNPAKISYIEGDAKEVEWLMAGAQCVLPPSIHPDTQQPYVWLTPDSLDSLDISELPELTAEKLESFTKAMAAIGLKTSKAKKKKSAAVELPPLTGKGKVDADKLDSVRRHLLTMEKPQGGSDRAIWLAACAFAQGQTPPNPDDFGATVHAAMAGIDTSHRNADELGTRLSVAELTRKLTDAWGVVSNHDWREKLEQLTPQDLELESTDSQAWPVNNALAHALDGMESLDSGFINEVITLLAERLQILEIQARSEFWGRFKGLVAGKRFARFRGFTPDASEVFQLDGPTDYVALADVPKALADAETWLAQQPKGDKPNALLLTQTVGTGKTTFYINQAVKLAARGVQTVFYVPNRTKEAELIGEINQAWVDAGKAGQIASGIVRREPENCAEFEGVLECREAGLDVAQAMCKSACGAVCPAWSQCNDDGYQAQKQALFQYSILVLCHAHLSSPIPSSFGFNPETGRIVVDENFKGSLLAKPAIRAANLKAVSRYVPTKADIAEHGAADHLQADRRSKINNARLAVLDALVKEQPLGDAWRAYCASRSNKMTKVCPTIHARELATWEGRWLAPDVKPGDSASRRRAKLESIQKENNAKLKPFWTALADAMEANQRGQLDQIQATTDKDSNDVFQVGFVKECRAFNDVKNVVFLDATADQRQIEALTGLNAHHRHISVAQNIQITQVTGHSNSAQSIEKASGKKRVIESVRFAALQVKANQRQTLLVGATKVIAKALAKARDSLGLNGDELPVRHMSELPGLNEFESFDCLVAFGRFKRPPESIEGDARALFPNQGKVLDAKPGWGWVQGPGGQAALVPRYTDLDLQALADDGSNLLEQAIGRLRGVRATDTKHVYILSDEPCALPVAHVVSWADAMPGLWAELLLTYGAIPTSAGKIAEVPTRDGVRYSASTWKRPENRASLVTESIESLIDYVTSEITLPGQAGGQRTPIAFLPTLDAKQAAGKVLGLLGYPTTNTPEDIEKLDTDTMTDTTDFCPEPNPAWYIKPNVYPFRERLLKRTNFTHNMGDELANSPEIAQPPQPPRPADAIILSSQPNTTRRDTRNFVVHTKEHPDGKTVTVSVDTKPPRQQPKSPPPALVEFVKRHGFYPLDPKPVLALGYDFDALTLAVNARHWPGESVAVETTTMSFSALVPPNTSPMDAKALLDCMGTHATVTVESKTHIYEIIEHPYLEKITLAA